MDASGTTGTGQGAKALRAFLRDEHDATVQLSLFGGWSLARFFAHSDQALQRMEEEIRIGIRVRMPLSVFTRRLRADDTLAILALDVAQAAEREAS